MLKRLLIALTLAPLTTAPLSAHDFWLASLNWTPAPNTPVTLTAGIGERFPARTPFRPVGQWLAAWGVLGADGALDYHDEFFSHDLVMATDVTLPTPGAYLGVAVVYAQMTIMPGREFTDYLNEVGLDHIVEQRKAAGVGHLPATERYMRYAKVAVRNGDGDGGHITHPVGVEAEFVPSQDPSTLRAGDTLTVQLLVGGEPIANAAVRAESQHTLLSERTDARGFATFTIPKDGAWLIKTVHMVEMPPEDAAEWESYWVTLAFHTRA